MEREMLYNFIINSYIGPQFYDSSKIYDYTFNKKIEFNECYRIQEDIKKSILNNIYNIKIDYCDFINEINITFNSTIKSNPELFYDDSRITHIKRNKITLELIDRDWNNLKTKEHFNYNLIRYSLYIAYYYHLKENNLEHPFVKFIEYISKLDFNDFTISNTQDNFSNYIIDNTNNLKTTKNQNNINEILFHNIISFGNELRFNWNKIHFNLE